MFVGLLKFEVVWDPRVPLPRYSRKLTHCGLFCNGLGALTARERVGKGERKTVEEGGREGAESRGWECELEGMGMGSTRNSSTLTKELQRAFRGSIGLK